MDGISTVLVFHRVVIVTMLIIMQQTILFYLNDAEQCFRIVKIL